jgi:hypothetical protein
LGRTAADRVPPEIDDGGKSASYAKAAKTPNEHRTLAVGATMGQSYGSVYVIDVAGLVVEAVGLKMRSGT